MNRFLVVHPAYGIYLGSCMGLGFWTKLDPAGQTAAVTFASTHEAETFLASLDGGRPPNLQVVEVVPDQGDYASIAACKAAGLDGWDPHEPLNKRVH